MIKLKDLITEDTCCDNCKHGESCCSINESIKLDTNLGGTVQMGKIFTGFSKSFVKEEDLNEAKEINKSDVTKLVKMAKKIDKDLNTLTKFYKKKIYNVNNNVVYKTWLSLDSARREYSIKAMSGIEFLQDHGWE